jgi:hypothetical protein
VVANVVVSAAGEVAVLPSVGVGVVGVGGVGVGVVGVGVGVVGAGVGVVVWVVHSVVARARSVFVLVRRESIWRTVASTAF